MSLITWILIGVYSFVSRRCQGIAVWVGAGDGGGIEDGPIINIRLGDGVGSGAHQRCRWRQRGWLGWGTVKAG